jgi:hypothetical protein
MGDDVIGGRRPSWQAMVSVENFHRFAGARPPPADTPDTSSVVTTSQVTPSIHDFAVSLVPLAADAYLKAPFTINRRYAEQIGGGRVVLGMREPGLVSLAMR